MTTPKQDKPHQCTEEAGLSPGVPHHRLCSQPCSRRLRLVPCCSRTRCPNQRVASSSCGSNRNLFSRVLRTDQGFIQLLFHPSCSLIPLWDPMLSVMPIPDPAGQRQSPHTTPDGCRFAVIYSSFHQRQLHTGKKHGFRAGAQLFTVTDPKEGQMIQILTSSQTLMSAVFFFLNS